MTSEQIKQTNDSNINEASNLVKLLSPEEVERHTATGFSEMWPDWELSSVLCEANPAFRTEITVVLSKTWTMQDYIDFLRVEHDENEVGTGNWDKDFTTLQKIESLKNEALNDFADMVAGVVQAQAAGVAQVVGWDQPIEIDFEEDTVDRIGVGPKARGEEVSANDVVPFVRVFQCAPIVNRSLKVYASSGEVIYPLS